MESASQQTDNPNTIVKTVIIDKYLNEDIILIIGDKFPFKVWEPKIPNPCMLYKSHSPYKNMSSSYTNMDGSFPAGTRYMNVSSYKDFKKMTKDEVNKKSKVFTKKMSFVHDGTYELVNSDKLT